MSGKMKLGVLVIVIAAALASLCIYTVDEREKAIVFQFGKIVKTDDNPGLKFKLPVPIQTVQYFDARIQTLDAEPERYLTVEKKNLVVDSFVKWRIQDVAKFRVTVKGLIANARARLAQRVNDSLRQEFGKRTVEQVISGDRVMIMDVVRKAINEEAAGIGVDVVDVRLKRVDLDADVSESVYRRMEAEREKVAKDLRALGAEAAERIRADADRQRTILLAEAFKQSEELRGEGDAVATEIYANAFGQDKEFFSLYRSLNAYKTSFGDKSDLIVLEPDSEFFKYFNQSRSDGPAAIDRVAGQ